MNLPEYSALTVLGLEVTQEQASDIILRLSDPALLYTKSEVLRERLAGVYGLRSMERSRELNCVRLQLGMVPLVDHLSLCERVITDRFGGPYGWMHWSGVVLSNDYDLGPWVDPLKIKREWAVIASFFPYLTLEAQLWSIGVEEAHTGLGCPRFTYHVRGGKVEMERGGEVIFRPEKQTDVDLWRTKAYTKKWELKLGQTLRELTLCLKRYGIRSLP